MWRLCWHDWSMWETYVWRGTQYGSRGFLITGDVSPREVSQTMQVRRCHKCGKELHRIVPAASGAAYGDLVKT